jgi:carboxyl-terminal processing protease
MSRRNLTLLLLATAFCWLCFIRNEQDPYARYMVEGYEKIDRHAYQQVPDRELFQGAMDGMVAVLKRAGDDHSQFITERQAQFFREEINQEIGGIGVRLRFEGEPPVLEVAGPPMEGKPADRAGLVEGDVILAIDDFDTTGLTEINFDKVLERMRGKPGDAVRLSVLHKGEKVPVTLKVVREKLTLDSLRGDRLLSGGAWQYVLEEDPRIALVRITSFGAKTYTELTDLLPKLQETGTEAVILDLRGNPGGLLDSAVATCELFLPAEKLIVETRDRQGEARSVARSSGDGPYVDMPLVVLIDRNSASASEIVAACLEDHGRAVVIGERTYGKGTVQETLPMQAGDSTLKLTTASFWRPSGRNIHRHEPDRTKAMADPEWGVAPNEGFEIEMTLDEYVDWAKARVLRDTTTYDPAADQSTEDSEDTPLYADPAVELAVAHLQELLDSRQDTEKPSDQGEPEA